MRDSVSSTCRRSRAKPTAILSFVGLLARCGIVVSADRSLRAAATRRRRRVKPNERSCSVDQDMIRVKVLDRRHDDHVIDVKDFDIRIFCLVSLPECAIIPSRAPVLP